MNELNITPLLDLAFVLLVIFIISTAPMVNDLDLNLPPKNKPQKPQQQKKPNLIIVESDGRVFFNGQEIKTSALLPELKRLRREDKDTAVGVFGDAAVRYQVMVEVFDALQLADIQKVGLATDRPATAQDKPQAEEKSQPN